MECIEEDNGDLFIKLNDEDLEKLGWEENDTIEILPNSNGSITLEKPFNNEKNDGTI